MGNEKARIVVLIARNINVHLAWGFCVAISVIVWNFSVENASNDDVVESISLALAISSMIVGLYAIFQAIFSGKSLLETATSLSRSSEQITSTALLVESASKILSEKIDHLPVCLDSMESKLDEIRSQAQNKVSVANGDDALMFEFDENYINRFFYELSNGGSVSLYCCLMSMKKNEGFDTNLVFIEDEFMSSYVGGFVGCLDSAGLIDISLAEDNLTFLVKGMGNIPEARIQSDIADAARDSEYIAGCKAAIDKFFQGRRRGQREQRPR